MFSPDIVESDAFLDMPISSQALYFHLAMNSDDDGFVNPKRIMRLVGVNDDDLKVLLTKRFLLNFESGVVVVKHWLIHNLIRSDLYKETLYKKEKSLIGLNDNGAYTELRKGISELKKIEPPKWLILRQGKKRTANVPQTALRLGKDRLGKVRNTTAIVEPKVSTKVVKNTPPKPPPEPEPEWDWIKYRDGMEKGNRRDLEIIAYFFKKKEIVFENKEQAVTGLKRWLKIGSALKSFSDQQISKATQKAIEQHPDIWTLETVLKKLTS